MHMFSEAAWKLTYIALKNPDLFPAHRQRFQVKAELFQRALCGGDGVNGAEGTSGLSTV